MRHRNREHTPHVKLALGIQSTHEQWDEGHATILVGTAACLLHLYDSSIDVSTNPLLMAVGDVDALATRRYVATTYSAIRDNPHPRGKYTVQQLSPEIYESEGFRVIGQGPHYAEMPFEVFSQDTWSEGGIDVNEARQNAMVRDTGQLIMPMADIIRWKLNIARARDIAYCAELLRLLEQNDYLLPQNQTELTEALARKREQYSKR